MNVLILSSYPESLRATIERTGDSTLVTTDRISVESLERDGIEFVVSYGYRHLLREPVLARLPNRIINLHISWLPMNRGADPNLWSWIDDTPKGVTIHRIDAGLDTGDILVQEPVTFGPAETLASSYAALRGAIEALFARAWPDLRDGRVAPRAQTGPGSSHSARDKEALLARLPLGWDTPVAEVVALARSLGL